MKCIENEIPFEVPEGWAWCRFTSVTVNRDSERKPISSANRTNVAKIYDYYGASGKIDKIDKFIFNEKLLLIGEDGANLVTRSKPIAFFAEGQYWVNNHAHCIDSTDKLILEYLCLYINAISLEKYVTGSAQPKMTQDNMNSILIALPPYEEQKRLEFQVNHILKTVSTIENEKEDIVNYISSAKSKILDLAIRGKLVPQNPNAEPASVLLERIRAEKEELIKAGKIKRDKKESIIFRGEDNSYYEKIGNEVHCIDEDIPFKISHNWIWCRMSSISDIIMGTSPKGTSICENPQYTEFHQGKIYFSDMLIKNSGQYTRELTKIAKPNSILLCVRAPVGEVNLTDRKICIGRGLASISPLGAVSRYFMLYWIKAFRETLIKKATGTTFVAVTTDVVKGLLLPIPPLAEQYRITNKIQSLVENLIYIEKSLR